jgi:predicted flap endonuclease-1-like 5' DNA nuclease
VNGLSLLVTLLLAVGIMAAYRLGVMRARRADEANRPTELRPIATYPGPAPLATDPMPAAAGPSPTDAQLEFERARLLRSLEAENAALRLALTGAAAERSQLQAFADERRRLLADLADARRDVARYRDIVIDLENNAMPPLLEGGQMVDDLKLIVGVGPVLERMLHQLGITSYRQIARWTERDIDEFDARLPEFPGRIRRDAWVTQARALHQSKFGEASSPR